MDNKELNGLITNKDNFAEEYIKMRNLLLEAKTLLLIPHRSEETENWIEQVNKIVSNK